MWRDLTKFHLFMSTWIQLEFLFLLRMRGDKGQSATGLPGQPSIYLKWKFLCSHLCWNLQYFCNSITETKLRHKRGVDCTFFCVFSKLLKGTNFGGQKLKILLFRAINSSQSFPLPLKRSFRGLCTNPLGSYLPWQITYGCALLYQLSKFSP